MRRLPPSEWRDHLKNKEGDSVATNQYAHMGLRNAGEKWTPQQETLLIMLIRVPTNSWTEIASIMGRTENAIITRVRALVERYFNTEHSLLTDAALRDFVLEKPWTYALSRLKAEPPFPPAQEPFFMIKGPEGPPRVKHDTWNQVEAEASRLAHKHPGQEIFILKAVAVVEVENTPTIKVRSLT